MLRSKQRTKTNLGNDFEEPHNKVSNWLTPMKYVAMAILSTALPVQAAVYYVNIEAGSDSNSGTSIEAAWAHVPGAVGFSGSGWKILRDGDTLVVKGGTLNQYRVQFTANYYVGTAKYNSITIQSGHLFSPPWGNGRAVFDQQKARTWAMAIGAGSGDAVLGLTIDGFELKNIAAGAAGPPWDDQTGSACIEIGGNTTVSYITIKRCWLHDAVRSVDNTGHGIEYSRADHTIITQNHIGPNIGTKGIEPYNSSYGQISNNFISGTGDHCIALTRTQRFDVFNNVIYHIPPQVHEPTYAIALPSTQYCDIWNNLIYRDTPISAAGYCWSMGIGAYTAGSGGDTVGNRIVFNTVAFFGSFLNTHESTAIRVTDYPSGNIHSDLVFQNNLVYGNFNSAGNIQYFVVPSLMSGDNVSFNDFFGSSTNENVMDSRGGEDTLSTVAGFSSGTGHVFANNVQLSPGFLGGTLTTGIDGNYLPNTSYFALTSSSPSALRYTGNHIYGDATHGYLSDANKFSTDIVGRIRSNWSIGAYEYPLYASSLRMRQ